MARHTARQMASHRFVDGLSWTSELLLYLYFVRSRLVKEARTRTPRGAGHGTGNRRRDDGSKFSPPNVTDRSEGVIHDLDSGRRISPGFGRVKREFDDDSDT